MQEYSLHTNKLYSPHYTFHKRHALFTIMLPINCPALKNMQHDCTTMTIPIKSDGLPSNTLHARHKRLKTRIRIIHGFRLSFKLRFRAKQLDTHYIINGCVLWSACCLTEKTDHQLEAVYTADTDNPRAPRLQQYSLSSRSS